MHVFLFCEGWGGRHVVYDVQRRRVCIQAEKQPKPVVETLSWFNEVKARGTRATPKPRSIQVCAVTLPCGAQNKDQVKCIAVTTPFGGRSSSSTNCFSASSLPTDDGAVRFRHICGRKHHFRRSQISAVHCRCLVARPSQGRRSS